MAVTFALTKVMDYTVANRRHRVRDVSATGTYTTGGDSLTASAFGLKKIEQLIIHGEPSDGTLAYPATYLYSTSLLKFWETGAANAGLAEKGSAESISTTTFRCTAVGY